MGKLIDKDKVFAEIERKYETNLIGAHSAFRNGKIEALREVKDFLNTLEAKEANEALRTEYERGRADTIKEFQDALVNHQGHAVWKRTACKDRKD